MNKKIGFIAVGQAGGNIGKLFEEKGYSVLYLNTSEEDLNTLDGVKYKHHIDGGEGCNKNRNKAKQLIIDDFDNIAQEIDTKIDKDMIFVIFSSGGGTGSGAAPMLIDLLVDDHTVGAITVIPAANESLRSQMNSYESLKELLSINGSSSCFIIDNDNGDKLELNEKFVNSFDKFVTIPNRDKSLKGIIDRAEIIETLKAHGMAYVLESDSDCSTFINNIKSNVFAPLEGDQVVKYIAASITGDTKIEDIQKAIGTPLDTFVTYNDKSTVCCISGLSYPQQRFDSVYKIVEKSRDTVVKNLKSPMEVKMKSDIDFLNVLGTDKSKAKEEHKPKSKRDIMSKYLR
ncbi:MAG TPA: hypothetical protein DCE48_09330 [Lachnospiraceae bacterium]|uniref:hypothetical protein n=1 Tax=Anaerosporobacter sp. TaxID=1872529 RepID=UPI000EC9F682|nr:hypothetical protein [Anaerosporobacter sp.]HAB60890.1 hypothetical protein [Lachnospiraceae bacterium]